MSPSSPERLQTIFQWLRGTIQELGYELYDVEDLKISGEKVLRITIDSVEGIQLEDCVRVDKLVNQILNDKDPIPNNYILEVSSPGIFRTLNNPGHLK